MGSVYLMSMRQMFGRWRFVIMTVLAALPITMASIALLGNGGPGVNEFETIVFSGMLAGSIIPLVVLAIATSAFANEIEDRTLSNLTLSPVPRWQIVVPKLLAAITWAAPFIGVSAYVATRIAFPLDNMAVFSVTASALVGVALYASAFVWLGLVSTQAIGLGLLYIVLWEGFFAGFVSGVRLLSIRYHAISLMHVIDPRRFANDAHPDAAATVAIVVLIFFGFLLLSVRQLRKMDVP